WLAWHEDGSLHARTDALASPPHAGTPPALAAISRNPAGRPQAVGGRTLHYQAQGRLAEVHAHGRVLVRYVHNARGQQIRRIQDGRITERYYVDNRLAAVWHRPTQPAAQRHDSPRPEIFGVTQRYLYAGIVPVGLLQTDADGRTHLYYLHADLRGAPVLATDAHRTVRWAAHHDALGR